MKTVAGETFGQDKAGWNKRAIIHKGTAADEERRPFTLVTVPRSVKLRYRLRTSRNLILRLLRRLVAASTRFEMSDREMHPESDQVFAPPCGIALR